MHARYSKPAKTGREKYMLICIFSCHRAVKVSDFIRTIGFYVDTALTRTDFAFLVVILGFCYAVPIYYVHAHARQRRYKVRTRIYLTQKPYGTVANQFQGMVSSSAAA